MGEGIFAGLAVLAVAILAVGVLDKMGVPIGTIWAGGWPWSTEMVKWLAWPVVVLVISARFHAEFQALFLRLLKAGKDGLEFAPPQAVPSEGSATRALLDRIEPAPAVAGSEITSNDGARAREEAPARPEGFEADAEKPAEAEDTGATADNQPDWIDHNLSLITDSSATKESDRLATEVLFDSIYSQILGSQIELLRALQLKRAMPEDAAQSYYLLSPGLASKRGFAAWINFLIANKLLRRVLDKKAVMLTRLGGAFLAYIEKRYPGGKKPY
jgi:hypothetical protein